MLSFIVIKKEDGTFVSTCIHLRIDGYGKTVDHAVQLMLAERDIATDKYSQLSQLQDKINELQSKVNELEKKIKKMNEKNTQIFRENILPRTIVGYEPAEAA
ncbi:MAG: hypothetical protein LBQ76_04395 [Candidatus Fibromonas sp.]|nr:hypothetical protein [Candidatus Fibromonas sp.]